MAIACSLHAGATLCAASSQKRDIVQSTTFSEILVRGFVLRIARKWVILATLLNDPHCIEILQTRVNVVLKLTASISKSVETVGVLEVPTRIWKNAEVEKLMSPRSGAKDRVKVEGARGAGVLLSRCRCTWVEEDRMTESDSTGWTSKP